MKTKTIFLSLLIVALVVINYSTGYSQALGSPKLGGKSPVITNYYSPELMGNGDALKIYIAAEDPDGEMLRIAVIVNQSGYGDYFTDWTYLKPGDQKSFKGYLQWNTHAGTILSELTRVTLMISVFDKAGLESNEVIIPLGFTSFGVSYPPPPAPFDQKDLHRLGYISVNLINPYRDSDRGNQMMFPIIQ